MGVTEMDSMQREAPGVGLVDVVVVLKPSAGGRPLAASQSKKMVKTVIDRVQNATGLLAEATTVFENLGSFAVRAPKRFVDTLKREKEVAQVIPNKNRESAFIAPIRKRPVTMPKLP